jgi:hypothetical protein
LGFISQCCVIRICEDPIDTEVVYTTPNPDDAALADEAQSMINEIDDVLDEVNPTNNPK